jgi:death-on-curing protein
VRDRGPLQSALARPRQLQAYGDNPDFAALAAAYTAGIIRNNPFINGHNFTASEESSARAVLNLAADTLDESAFAAWLRANLQRR